MTLARNGTAALELVRAHARALFTFDPRDRLVAVNEPGGAPAPRLFVGICLDGVAAWFRHDLPRDLVRDLRELCETIGPGRAFPSGSHVEASLVRRLAESAPVERAWLGPAFRFPRDLPKAKADDEIVRVTSENASVLEPLFGEWLDDVAADPPFAAVVCEGQAVSICCSVRTTPEVHEAGVETHPDHRGHGYAARAVVAWARLVRERAATPLYSTSRENEASLAVARKARLVQFSEDLHVT